MVHRYRRYGGLLPRNGQRPRYHLRRGNANSENAEKNGFVHQITNIDGENKIFAICNCNVNICNALRTSQLFNTPNMSRSAYVARVEKTNAWRAASAWNTARRSGKTRTKTLHETGRNQISEARTPRQSQLGTRQVGRRLPRQQPHQLLRNGYVAL